MHAPRRSAGCRKARSLYCPTGDRGHPTSRGNLTHLIVYTSAIEREGSPQMSVRAYDWVAYHARQTPEKLAMVDLHSGRQFTYRDMQDRTARLAGALRDGFGVQPGDRVAALANNSTDCMEMNFACMKLGAIYVPLNWRLTVSELEYIVGDAEPGLLIHEDVFSDEAQALKERCGVPALLETTASGTDNAYEAAIEAAMPLAGSAEITHDDTWVIMYTSGTTGHPKGCMITYGMTFWNVVNLLNPHRLSEDMVNLITLPLFHTGGLNVYGNPAVHMGGTNIVMRSFDPGETLRILQDSEFGITHMIGVPANYLFMSQHPDFAEADLSGLRAMAVGGAPTSLELLKIYADKGNALQQAFGMTETSPLVTALTPANALDKPGSAGLPALHTEIRLVDEEANEITAPSVVGELWVKGPNVTPGYWRRPDANESSFTDGWLHTGDAAYQDEDGFIYIVDRWKDMYISGGENVYPAEVENVIYQLPEVAEVAVIGVPHERWGETGQAVIVLKEGANLSEEAVLKHCKDKLARFKQPSSVRFIAEIPHNATGKQLKRELRGQ
jgi:fatty-acyl-CoA synthase